MKSKIPSLLLAVAALVEMALPPALQAQGNLLSDPVQSYQLGTFTGVQQTIAATTGSNVPTNSFIYLAPNRGVSLWPKVQTTGSTTGTVTYRFLAGYGTTTNDTFQTVPFELSVGVTGTNVAVGFTNFPATLLGNARTLQLVGITNTAGATVTLNGVYFGYWK